VLGRPRALPAGHPALDVVDLLESETVHQLSGLELRFPVWQYTK
jgi:hypothetical protein